MVESDEPHDTIIPRLRFACWIVYKQTLRICSTYCFSTATIATRTPLIVTWYVYCLSCLNGIKLKLIRIPCSQSHNTYYNYCTIIRYYRVQTCDSTPTFYIRGSVHRNSRLKKSNKMQQYADIYLLLNYSTCFGRPSSGVHKTVVPAK